MTVRRAAPDDYAEVARLTVEAYRADGQLEEEHGYGDVLADVATRAGHSEILVATDGAALLGAVAFVLPGSRYAELSKPGEAEFRMLAVDPAAQRRGVARALVRACVERAAALGCGSLVISTRDRNAAAFALYDTFGFVREPALDWTPVPGVRLLGLRLKLPSTAT
ncbi:GNAT family N-acetyltransferase [Dactylosporangium sp. NBC_01737]|uniref:GNAT family N-acetyltransferase n=1 Tax=Dactylosporangium sp. NBC_01737 TaxID=2975959 RepID=UPI002E11CC00|nr:GNAT family N-acetyltransferase [Dactylosporangium sp. NBC_01737]